MYELEKEKLAGICEAALLWFSYQNERFNGIFANEAKQAKHLRNYLYENYEDGEAIEIISETDLYEINK